MFHPQAFFVHNFFVSIKNIPHGNRESAHPGSVKISQNFGESGVNRNEQLGFGAGTKISHLWANFGRGKIRSAHYHSLRAAIDYPDFIHTLVTIPEHFEKLPVKIENGNLDAVYRVNQFQ